MFTSPVTCLTLVLSVGFALAASVDYDAVYNAQVEAKLDRLGVTYLSSVRFNLRFINSKLEQCQSFRKSLSEELYVPGAVDDGVDPVNVVVDWLRKSTRAKNNSLIEFVDDCVRLLSAEAGLGPREPSRLEEKQVQVVVNEDEGKGESRGEGEGESAAQKEEANWSDPEKSNKELKKEEKERKKEEKEREKEREKEEKEREKEEKERRKEEKKELEKMEKLEKELRKREEKEKEREKYLEGRIAAEVEKWKDLETQLGGVLDQHRADQELSNQVRDDNQRLKDSMAELRAENEALKLRLKGFEVGAEMEQKLRQSNAKIQSELKNCKRELISAQSETDKLKRREVTLENKIEDSNDEIRRLTEQSNKFEQDRKDSLEKLIKVQDLMKEQEEQRKQIPVTIKPTEEPKKEPEAEKKDDCSCYSCQVKAITKEQTRLQQERQEQLEQQQRRQPQFVPIHFGPGGFPIQFQPQSRGRSPFPFLF